MSVLPGSEGELGIMSRHTPLMTLLNRGIIKLFDENNSVTDQIAVDGGIGHNTIKAASLFVKGLSVGNPPDK